MKYVISFQCLISLVKLCLAEAETRRLTSIAFPPIGTKGLGYPLADVATAMIRAVDEFSQSTPTTTHLRSVVFSFLPSDADFEQVGGYRY